MENKIVILEGPDGGGKTLLAKSLEQRGYQYIHFGPPAEGEDLFVTYATALIAAAARNTPTVFDRLYLSELIYGAIFRGGSQLEDAEHANTLHSLAKALDARTIICLPSFNEVVAAWQAKSDDYTPSVVKLSEVYKAYEQAASRQGYERYNWQLDALNASTGLPSRKIVRPSLQAYYLNMLNVVASRSTCIRRPVGAILTAEDGLLLSTGYNGSPKGMAHCIDDPHADARHGHGDSLACPSIHAEVNCIIHASELWRAHTMYVSWSPCFDCAKLIASTQIKRVVIANKHRDMAGVEFLKRAGVEVVECS